MYHDEKTGGVTLSPKSSFILGLIGGVLVLCTIGFFLMLAVTLKGGLKLGNNDGGNYGNVPTSLPTGQAPTAAPSGDVVGEVKPIGDDDHVRGDKNAEVVLYEWSDFECPFCSRFHPTMVQLMNEYKGKVKWVYRHYPLSFHPQATPAANAAECAGEQGKFWEYGDQLFANQSMLGDTYYKQLAGEVGLNVGNWESCYNSKKYQAKITQQMNDGSAAGVTGTPGTVIVAKDGSKQLVPGAVPYEQLKMMVDTAIAAGN